MIGAVLTKPILYGAAIVVVALLGVIAAQHLAYRWQGAQLEGARRDLAAAQSKNARCELESAQLQGAVNVQNTALEGLERACSAAQTTAQAALDVAKGQRPATAREIAAILAGAPADPKDLCRSACVELRRR